MATKDSIKKLIEDAIKTSAQLLSHSKVLELSSVTGGCIHQAWRIELDDGRRLFAKTNDINNFNMMKYEFECLLALRKFSNESYISIPKPLKLHRNNNLVVLLLPWLEIASGNQANLGRGLALLHRSSSNKNAEKYGWNEDGFIGSKPQIKGWRNNWGEFFVNLRLRPQLTMASKWGFEINGYERLLSLLIPFLNKHKPLPSLIHGDLWSGNCGINNHGKGLLFDPASYWGDREVDIAMTKMFGGFSKEFYQEYKNTWPLSSTAKERVSIYNLYHLINHANIFGGSYKQQSIQEIEKIRLNLTD